jgi:mycofactocin precursor
MDPSELTNKAESGPVEDSTLIESDSLVEEISIDGMCGVY